MAHTIFPRIVRARSINFTVCVMRGRFEGALYSRARSIKFTVCVMRGLFETAVYSEGANYSRKYGIYTVYRVLNACVKRMRDCEFLRAFDIAYVLHCIV